VKWVKPVGRRYRKTKLPPWVCPECLVNLRPLVDFCDPLDHRWICPKCLQGWKERNPIFESFPHRLIKLGGWE
jgi:hypothetical protein